MRVLQLGKFYPVRGGVEKVMYDLTLGLSELGLDTDMLCARIEKDTDVDANGIVRLNEHGRVITVKALRKIAGTMIAPAMIWKLRRIASQYDVIHVHHPDPMAALSLWLSGYKGQVVLHWHSDILSQKLILFFYKPLQNWLIRRADLILGTTPVYVEQSPHLAWARSHGKRIDYLPIGVRPIHSVADTPDYRTAPDAPTLAEQVTAIRTRYEGRRIVYSLGRLIPYKGYEYLVEAARMLPDDVCVLIGGMGPLRNALQEKIDKLGLQGKVYLLGRVDESEFDAYYNACDLFCLSSIWKTEAFAIVQIEAMSAGKPIVATRIPESGVSWVNEDGCSGHNAEPADAKSLSDAVSKVLENTEFYSRGARERYSKLFTFEGMAQGCLDYYLSLKRTPEQDFIALLRTSLWGEKAMIGDNIDWRAVYELACKNGVQGTMVSIFGSNALKPSQMPDTHLSAEWKIEAERIESLNNDHAVLCEKMNDFWKENGLRAIMLKGRTIAQLYDVPDHRLCNDVDWYIPAGDWEKAVEVCAKQGLQPENNGNESVHFTREGIDIKLHRSWNSLEEVKSIEYLSSMGLDDALDPLSCALRFLLMQNIHILRRARTKGFAIRQVCDLAMSYRALATSGLFGTNAEEVNSRLREALEVLGLLKWTDELHHYLVLKLGMPARFLPW